MFGISIAEFVVIVVVALLVVPGEKWPEIARFLAKTIKFAHIAHLWQFAKLLLHKKQQYVY